MSLLSSTTISLRAARNPALDPPPKPRLRSSTSTFTDGKCSRKNSALPSVDAFSTTMISLSGLPDSASTTDGKYIARRPRPFQFGITTVADELEHLWSVGKIRFARKPPSKSVNAMAMIATNIKNGEMSRSGSDLISRERMVKKFLTGQRFSRSIEHWPQPQLAAELEPS